jgi:hypothetical protein
MGAVVITNIEAGAEVSGNFATNHRLNMVRLLKGH